MSIWSCFSRIVHSPWGRHRWSGEPYSVPLPTAIHECGLPRLIMKFFAGNPSGRTTGGPLRGEV